MNTTLRWLSVFGLALATAVPALSQGGTKPGLTLDNEKLSLQASFDPATARAGETVKLVLQATTIPGWHAYGFMEATELLFMNAVLLGPAHLPQP